jgi:hypothetical protein
MTATLVCGGFILDELEVKVRMEVIGIGEEAKEKGEVVAAVLDFCCEAVEAARAKGRPERREVRSLRRKIEENSLKVVAVCIS